MPIAIAAFFPETLLSLSFLRAFGKSCKKGWRDRGQFVGVSQEQKVLGPDSASGNPLQSG